jgi:hypothetical protein
VTGDGAITDNDVLIQIANKIGGQVGDVDGDGLVTATDTMLIIAQMLDVSGGDLTGDNQITVDDLSRWMQQFFENGTQDLIGLDVNSNMTADGEDLARMLSQLGEFRSYRSQFIAQWMLAPVNEFIQLYPQGVDPTQWVTSSDHVNLISSSYTPDGHSRVTSADYPDNHLHSNSRQWTLPMRALGDSLGPEFPSHVLSASTSNWPANHGIVVSRTWGTPTGHLTGTSETRPPVHNEVHSSGWKHHPNHVASVSHGWFGLSGESDPQPGSHAALVSRVWPSGHLKLRSDSGGPPEHFDRISGSVPELRRPFYPPNHSVENSGTWGPMHLTLSSTSFPANHIGEISSDREQRITPWPPNHTKQMSARDNEPISTFPTLPSLLPNGIVPADHSWLTTVQAVVPLFRLPTPAPTGP